MGKVNVRIDYPTQTSDEVLVMPPGEYLVRLSHLEVTEEQELVLVYQYVGTKHKEVR